VITLKDIIAMHPELARLADGFPPEPNAPQVIVDWFNHQDDGVKAMAAIEWLAAMRLPLPNELQPWLHEAIDAWRLTKGNKQRVRSQQTDSDRRMAVAGVSVLQSYGFSRSEAAEHVSQVFGKFKPATVIQYHDCGEYAADREHGAALADQIRAMKVPVDPKIILITARGCIK
jgi:hypothetical protein